MVSDDSMLNVDRREPHPSSLRTEHCTRNLQRFLAVFDNKLR